MSTGVPLNNNGNQPITNDSHGRQQTTFRMPLTLPEGKRLKLQQHQLKVHQQQQQAPSQVMDQSGQKPLHSPVPPISGYTQPHQQNTLQQQQQQPPQTQQQQPYYANPTYQQASVSRPAFEHGSSSYIHHGSAQAPQNTQHGQMQGRSQPNPYQYVPPQQSTQQYQPASTSSGVNTGMQQNYMNANNAQSSTTGNGNNNFQMYNLSGLPSSARPTTASGQQGMMTSKSLNAGPLSAQGQPLAMHGDESMAEGSGGSRRMDNNYNEYSVQVPSSANTSTTNHQSSSIAVPGSSKPSGSGMPTDMPAFTGGSFAMSASAPSGGTGTLSGYQVGMPPSIGLGQSVGQIGQHVQMQQDTGKPFGGSGQGQASGGADQEIFEVCQSRRVQVFTADHVRSWNQFMKRKRWPQLLMQELVGAVVWCLIPYQRRLSMAGDDDMDADDDGMFIPSTVAGKERRPSIKEELMRKPSSGWKVSFA
jgi:hypothetical protein